MPQSSELRNQPDVDSHSRSIRPDILLYAVGAWFGMVVLGLLNATFRELFVTPNTGEYPAHVISTATLLGLLAVYLYGYFRRMPIHSVRERMATGVLWAGLTVAFEFLFGHYVAGEAWEELLELYDVTRGNVWVFVPLFILVAPLLYGRYLSR